MKKTIAKLKVIWKAFPAYFLFAFNVMRGRPALLMCCTNIESKQLDQITNYSRWVYEKKSRGDK